MYEEYYGFTRSPFSLTPDPKFLYLAESHEHALLQVGQAIRRREGFIVLTGDIGTGKTTLCRRILQQSEPTTFTALVLNPFLTLEELLKEVLIGFGVISRDALGSGRLAAATKHELIRALSDFLLSLEAIHGSAVLIIDEAQHLSPDVLEEVRILSNLETNDRKLLLIVLVGQLNLIDVLRNPRLRQLDQRISIRCVLQPLTREGVEAYVTHRLTVAGSHRTVRFTPEAFDQLHTSSGGVPRLINLLCDRALMAGARSRAEVITASLVEGATSVLGRPTPVRAPWPAAVPSPTPAPPIVAPPPPPEPAFVEPSYSTMEVVEEVRFVPPEEPVELTAPLPASEPEVLDPEPVVYQDATVAPDEPIVLDAPARGWWKFAVAAVLLLALAGATAALWQLGGSPAEMLAAPQLPSAERPPLTALGVPDPPAPVPADTALSLAPPNIDTGPFSVLVGTYGVPKEAEQAIAAVRRRGLRVYAVDVRIEDVGHRRVLIGRFPRREDADKVRAEVLTAFPGARVVYGWYERVPDV